MSNPSSLTTAIDCAANASFASIRSRSSIFQLAFFSAFWTAGTGPIPIIDGSTPTDDHETIFAIISKPKSLALDSFIIKTAAAPSFRPDAFPAVTEPSFLKTGFKEEILSKVDPCLGNSSSSKDISSFFTLIFTGQISFLKWPDFCAFSALFWDSTAKESCSSLLILYFSAIFSAVVPIW